MVGQSKIKTIGVIGLGSIGMRHAKNLIQIGEITVLTHDPKNNGEQNLHNLLEESDAVVIASPTSTHDEYLKLTLKANKPTFVEKPVSDKRWIELPHVLMVGYNLRFHSCVKRAKEWIDEGFLGQPLWANFTVGQYNDRYTDGVILNWSHEIDLALYLLGPGSVAGSSTRISNGRDDISDILLTHDNGCRSYVHLDYITQPEIRQSIIVGSEATIIMDLLNREAWLRSKAAIMLDHQGLDDSFDENYQSEMEAFIDRIDDKETIGCTGAEALEVLKVCLEVRKQAGL